MTTETKVILNLSGNVRDLLEEQQIDLYEELQQDLPNLHVQIEADPQAPAGTRDLIQILYGSAAVIAALSPVIIHIINRFTPPNRTVSWKIKVTETHNPDGSVTTHRIYVYSEDEQRPWTAAPYADPQPPAPPEQSEQGPSAQ
jgi:hypothetical protein